MAFKEPGPKMQMSSWAETMKEHDEGPQLPPRQEKIEGNRKIVTEWELDKNNRKIKVVKTYEIVKTRITKGIEARRHWKPFGKNYEKAEVGCDEEIKMQFGNAKDVDGDAKAEEDIWAKAHAVNTNLLKCRICKGPHATLNCLVADKIGAQAMAGVEADIAQRDMGSKLSTTTDKYVIPSLKGDASRGQSMGQRLRDDLNTIRISNLPPEILDSDIRDLCSGFGEIARVYLAKDKYTGASRGYAFVSYKKPESCALAVSGLNGYGYANLIIKAEHANSQS